MKKGTIILLLILLLFLTSCSELITVLVRIININSNDTELRLHFDFRRMYCQEFSKVNRIEIYRNDTLICKLACKKEIGISEWDFPSIPNDFKIDTSIIGSNIPEILKTQNVRFVFAGGIKYPGYGSWNYQSKFSKSQYRWMFDENGTQNVIIDCYYEPWIGKDIIKIESTKDFQVIGSHFILKNAKGELIDFKIKYKGNPTNKIALVLNHSLKTGEILNLYFQVDSTRKYEEKIIVPDKAIIGIAGKYNDL